MHALFLILSICLPCMGLAQTFTCLTNDSTANDSTVYISFKGYGAPENCASASSVIAEKYRVLDNFIPDPQVR